MYHPSLWKIVASGGCVRRLAMRWGHVKTTAWDYTAMMDNDKVKLQFERLQRHYDSSVRTYDSVSLLDLSHSLSAICLMAY